MTHAVPSGAQLHQPFELNCLLNGDDSIHIFFRHNRRHSIRCNPQGRQDEKEVALEHIDADALSLWKVSIAAKRQLEENVSKFELLYVQFLNISPESPKVGLLHVIVQCKLSSGQL